MELLQRGCVRRHELLFRFLSMHAILLQVTLDPFRVDLIVRWHVFKHRTRRGMFETNVKNSRYKIPVQIFGPRKAFGPAAIGFGLFDFATGRIVNFKVIAIAVTIIISSKTGGATSLRCFASRSTATSGASAAGRRGVSSFFRSALSSVIWRWSGPFAQRACIVVASGGRLSLRPRQ